MAYDSTGNRSAQSKSSPSSLSNGNPFEMPTYQLHFRSIFGLLNASHGNEKSRSVKGQESALQTISGPK